MNLQSIPTIKGATHPTKRLGRGEANGRGKTCCKGHKGQKARSGGGIPVGFEGGQMPLYRKLPRRGFNNKNFKTSFQLVNVGDLEKVEGDTVNRETLTKAGLIRDNKQGVKLLGDGELSKAFTVEVDKVSGSAKAKIEAAGGKIIDAAVSDESADKVESAEAEEKEDA
jgi:large subunit ribosomal protein L15